MTNFIATLQYYFSYPFVQYALIVGVLIALCSSLLGVTLVLKRFSFIGDVFHMLPLGQWLWRRFYSLHHKLYLS